MSLTRLPVVTGNVIYPEGVADVLFTFLLVFAEARKDMNLIELGVDGGSLGKACHRHYGGKKIIKINMKFNSEIKTVSANLTQLSQ